MTLSGGEVLMAGTLCDAAACRLRRYGIHTAIETAGDAPLSRCCRWHASVMKYCLTWKIMDPEQARSGDGSKSS